MSKGSGDSPSPGISTSLNAYLLTSLLRLKKKKTKNIRQANATAILFYYIDTSVLLENIPLVKFMKTTSGTRMVYFPKSHTLVYR